MVLKARVEHGKIIANAPEGYVDGTEIEIEILDALGMDSDERAALDASIEDGERDFEEGRFIEAEVLLAKLHARRA